MASAVSGAVFEIHPIRCGTIDITKGGLTYLTDQCVETVIPVVVFAVVPESGDGPVVLVDAGAGRGDVAGKSIPDGGFEPIREGLADLGVEPADVDYLVLTHLHHDHAANVASFPDAEVLVQRRELVAARDPLPTMARTYVDDHVAQVTDADLTLVDGGYRLHEGIDLRLAPGHTRGMQVAFVETAGGEHCIAGDLGYCPQNFDPGIDAYEAVDGSTVRCTPQDGDYLPPGLHVSVADCFESVRRVRERVTDDARIVGGHLPAVLEGPYPR